MYQLSRTSNSQQQLVQMLHHEEDMQLTLTCLQQPACYLGTFWLDTFDVSIQVLSFTLLSGTNNVLQIPSELPKLQIEP